jgi:hypothetical protein
MGVTFIGHASFFLQVGGENVVIDPNFARWLFVLKRLRKPGVRIDDLPPIDLVLITHAHFDHLHRPSLRALVQHTKRWRGSAPTIVVPEHVFDLVSDLGFRDVVELNWWSSYRHRMLIAGTGATCCATASIRFITPETPHTFLAFAKSGCAFPLNSLCFPLALITRLRFAMSIPAQPMPPEPSLI